MALKDFYLSVDKKRQEGLTDTQILDGLSRNSKSFSDKISKVRGGYAGGVKIKNDRDLLNALSVKFSGRMPSVASIAPKSVSEAIDQNQIREDRKGFFGRALKFGSDIAQGAKKGVASTTLGIASLPQKAGVALGEAITGEKSDIFGKTIRERVEETGALKAETTGEKIGKGVEQLAEFFVPVGGAAKVASKIPKLVKPVAKIAGTGAEFGGKTLVQTGDVEKAKDVGVISAVIPVFSGAVKVFGKKLAESAISLSAKEAKVVQAYKANNPFWERVFSGEKSPITAAKTAVEKRLAGTESMIGIQATRAKDSLWKNIISPQLKKSTVKVDMKNLFSETKKKIISDNPEISRQKSLLNALESLVDDYKGVNRVSLEQLQKLKEGWAKFLPDKVFKGKPIAGAFNDVKNVISGISRNTIHNNISQEARRAYFDYGNLIGLQELGQKAMTGGKLKGGFGGFWSSIKDTALTPILTVGGQSIYKIGQGIELVGKQGAKTLVELFE